MQCRAPLSFFQTVAPPAAQTKSVPNELSSVARTQGDERSTHSRGTIPTRLTGSTRRSQRYVREIRKASESNEGRRAPGRVSTDRAHGDGIIVSRPAPSESATHGACDSINDARDFGIG